MVISSLEIVNKIRTIIRVLSVLSPLLLHLSACQEQDKIETDHNKEIINKSKLLPQKNITTSSGIEINTENNLDGLENKKWETFINTENGKRVNPEVMKTLFPKSIGGYTLNTPSGGVLHYSGYSVSTSGATYNIDRGSLSVIIQDYGDKSIFPERTQFAKLPVVTGMLVEKVTIDNAIAYLIWDNQRKSGLLNSLFFDRFIVKIEADNILFDKEVLNQLLQSINIKKLKELTLIDKIKN